MTASSNYQYIRVEKPEQLEPGDTVYQVIRHGTREEDVKYNEMRVMTVERRAVQALRHGGPRGSRPITLPFTSLVIRAPESLDRKELTHRADIRPIHAHVVVRATAQADAIETLAAREKPDAVATCAELIDTLLQDLRIDLESLDEEKAELQNELSGLDTAHRQELERLNELVRKANHQHQKKATQLQERLDDVEERRAPLQKKADSIESMLSAVRG